MNSNENLILSPTQLSQTLKDELLEQIHGTDREWTIFSKTDEVIIKTCWDKNNNCRVVLTEGIIHAPPQICQHALTVLDAFKDFNPFCLAMNCLENLDERTDILHAIFSFPIPITPREFCFFRYHSLPSDPENCVIIRSVEHSKVPLNNSYVRGTFYTTGVVVEPVETEPFKSRIYLLSAQELFIEDPKFSKSMEEINVTFGARVIPLLAEYIKNNGLNRQKQYLTKMENNSFKEMMDIFSTPPDDKHWKKVLQRQSLEVWSKQLSNTYRMCTSGLFNIDIPPRTIFEFIKKLPPGALDPFCRTMYKVEQITDSISAWYISWKSATPTGAGDAVVLVSARMLPGSGYTVLHRSVTHSRVPPLEGFWRADVPPGGWFIHPAQGGKASLVSYCFQGDVQAILESTKKSIEEIEQDFAVRSMSLVHSLQSLLLREQKNSELTAQIIQVTGTNGTENVFANDTLRELMNLSHDDQQILRDLTSPNAKETVSPRENIPDPSPSAMKISVNTSPDGQSDNLISVTISRPLASNPPSVQAPVSFSHRCPCNCWQQRKGRAEQYFSLLKSSLLGCQQCGDKQAGCFCNSRCQCNCSRHAVVEERPTKRQKQESSEAPQPQDPVVDLTCETGNCPQPPAPSSQSLLPSIRNFHPRPQEVRGKKFLFTPSQENMLLLSELEMIPNEIFLNIMSYLDPSSVGKLGQVNRRFRSLSEERLLWKDFFLARYSSKLPAEYDEHTFDFKGQFRAIMQKSLNWRRGLCTKQDLQGHSKAIRSIEANGDYIVSGSTDKMVKVWDRKTGTCIRTFYANNGGVLGVSLDKNKVCTGYRTGAVKTWDIPSGSCESERNFGYYAEGFTFFDDKAAAWDFSIDVWNMSTGQMEKSLNQHTKKVNCVAVFNKPAEEEHETDTMLLGSGSADKTIKVWNLATGECIRTFQGHSAGVTALDLNDKIVVSGSNDKIIRIWDMKTGNTLLPLKGHTNAIKCLKIYEDMIISGSTDNTVRIWTMKGDQHFTLQANQNITCLQVDSDQILAGCSDGTIIVWDFSAKETQQQSA